MLKKETQVYILDKEGASQSFIIMGHLSDKYDASGDHFKSKIMNYPLGGGMSGRFFLNLREDKGWTYGANSMFMASDKIGAFAMFSSVKTEATDSALVEIFNEYNSYANHYADTLIIWREKFNKEWDMIKDQGFDLTFKRMWQFYLSYCEAGFKSKNIDLIQFSLCNK